MVRDRDYQGERGIQPSGNRDHKLLDARVHQPFGQRGGLDGQDLPTAFFPLCRIPRDEWIPVDGGASIRPPHSSLLRSPPAASAWTAPHAAKPARRIPTAVFGEMTRH